MAGYDGVCVWILLILLPLFNSASLTVVVIFSQQFAKGIDGELGDGRNIGKRR